LNFEVYVGGRPAQTVVLKKSEPGWNEVVGIVASKQGQWDTTLITFAPVVRARSENITLDFQRGRVVANFMDGKGKPRQVIAPLADVPPGNDEFSRVLQVLEASAARDAKVDLRVNPGRSS